LKPNPETITSESDIEIVVSRKGGVNKITPAEMMDDLLKQRNRRKGLPHFAGRLKFVGATPVDRDPASVIATTIGTGLDRRLHRV
jgi:hypothetical protein